MCFTIGPNQLKMDNNLHNGNIFKLIFQFLADYLKSSYWSSADWIFPWKTFQIIFVRISDIWRFYRHLNSFDFSLLKYLYIIVMSNFVFKRVTLQKWNPRFHVQKSVVNVTLFFYVQKLIWFSRKTIIYL